MSLSATSTQAALGLSRASLEALSNALDDRAKSGILWGSKAGHVPNECDATLEVEGLAEVKPECRDQISLAWAQEVLVFPDYG